jgi:hypothetical protein
VDSALTRTDHADLDVELELARGTTVTGEDCGDQRPHIGVWIGAIANLQFW